jgi:hypothetical protein
MRIQTVLGLLALASIGTSCSEEGEGTLHTRIYGEAFIEEGIPADVFVDGWSVTFTRFIVVVDGISAHDTKDGGRYAFDLVPGTSGAGQEVTELAVPEGGQSLEYRIAPGGAADGGNASAADAQMMADNGWSVFVEGSATKDGAAISFAWGFDSTTEYSHCEVVESVPADGEATTVMTIHADHVFYDDLDSEEPNVAFDLVAASDADMDGIVTREELLARDISAEARYQVGSRDIANLWDFMNAQTSTLGHIDGEGHCAF